MPGVYKRPHQKNKPGSRYTAWWIDENGNRVARAAFVDKTRSIQWANLNQNEADMVRRGLMAPQDLTAKKANADPIAKHAADYAASIRDRGRERRHYEGTESQIVRLLAEARITRLSEITEGRLRPTLSTWARTKSASTANHAMTAIKGFAKWLDYVGRIKGNTLRGMTARYNEEADRKRVRRALTAEQMASLIRAAEQGAPVIAAMPLKSRHHSVYITGHERAIVYRIAMGTGFRARTIRLIQPEDFRFDAENPRIEIDGGRFKNGKPMKQPIRRDLAEFLQPWVESLEPGRPIVCLPARTADMLKVDLKSAGIAYKDARGEVIDFHALRVSYLNAIGRSGCDPRTMMELAGHADFKTTMRYLRSDDTDKRKALGE